MFVIVVLCCLLSAPGGSIPGESQGLGNGHEGDQVSEIMGKSHYIGHVIHP